MFRIIGSMAEFERSLIQERVRAGLRMHGLRARSLEGRVCRLTLSEWLSCAVTGFRGPRYVSNPQCEQGGAPSDRLYA